MNKFNDQVSRRRFLEITIGAAGVALLPVNFVSADSKKEKVKKPNSKFGGVQVGAITYSWRSMSPTAEDTLKYQGPARLPREASDDQKAAFQKASQEAAQAQKEWRTTVPMTKFIELRKTYNKAGVKIHIAKFSPENWSDAEIDYAFNAAKALGAKGVSTEISEKSCQKLGPFAEKHGMYAIMHQHLQPGEPNWTFEKFLAYSPAIMLNYDAGHYFGATGLHPNRIVEKLHDRIFSIHMKDKTGPKGTPPNTNMEWGKGETPIADILLLLQKNKWPINVDIELEYPVPQGSDAVAEVKKCVEYCRNILV
jgi:sugar phosphate isomerase/epimerase